MELKIKEINERFKKEVHRLDLEVKTVEDKTCEMKDGIDFWRSSKMQERCRGRDHENERRTSKSGEEINKPRSVSEERKSSFRLRNFRKRFR